MSLFFLILAFVIIWTSATVIVVYGYHTPDSTDKFNGTYTDSDYCSAFDYNGTKYVEYCIVGLKGIQCSEPEEQIICQEHNRNLEKLGQ